MKKNQSVLVAMSGGIDSSVSASILKEKGYQVNGIFFRFIDDEDFRKAQNSNQNNISSGRQRVQIVAQKLAIPMCEIDYRKRFRQIVIEDFIRKYQRGMTPNPCILCNEKMKFSLLFDYASKKGIQFIATGHYARVEKDKKLGRYFLKRGLDPKKDQSYFLYRLNETILSRCIFPLGSLIKIDVEKIAREIGLEFSKIKESQEICFIPGNNYRKLMELETNQEEKSQSGYFLDTSGNLLGKHKGIAFYTIGQRRKIGLSLNTRKYIIRINPKDNTIIVGNESDLYRREFKVTKVHYISTNPILEPIRLQVQIRYNAPPAPATIFPCREGGLYVLFSEPQRAITPGQSAVFYNKEIVIGGGIISYF